MSWESVLKKKVRMHPIVLDALEREFQTGKPLNSDNLKTIANDAVNTENEKEARIQRGFVR